MGTRIGIIGVGAIGSIVGGLLTKAGHDVTLIDQWPDHVQAMKHTGLRLSGTCGEHLIPVRALGIHELQSVAEPFDAVFISVKSYDTEWAVSLALQYLAIHLAAEAILVGRARGHEVEPIWGIKAQRFVDAVQGRGLADVERDMAERAKELAGGRPSLLQDVMRGRRTEVQYLNGYVSEQGRQVGVPTPFNDKIVELITRVPPGTLKPDLKNLDPLVGMLPK
jgi:2-dehydropantoate 2-reductase